MSSSSSSRPRPLATPELRSGTWTRFGGETVLGDAVTEQTLHSLAESTRTAARSQGYAVGWSEGQRAARDLADEEARIVAATRLTEDDRREAEHRSAVRALELAAVRLHETVETVCARLEEQAAALAGELTATILGELRVDVDAVRRALALAPEGDIVALRVHPSQVVEAEVRVIADPSLEVGDALVEYDDHVLDLRISTALDRVRAVLR